MLISIELKLCDDGRKEQKLFEERTRSNVHS